LQVAAKDLRNGEEHLIEVQPSYGLNDADIERMLEESTSMRSRISRAAVDRSAHGAESSDSNPESAGENPKAASLSEPERVKVDKRGGGCGKP